MPRRHKLQKIGFRFHFYSDEGTEPPQIRVETGDGECKFIKNTHIEFWNVSPGMVFEQYPQYCCNFRHVGGFKPRCKTEDSFNTTYKAIANVGLDDTLSAP